MKFFIFLFLLISISSIAEDDHHDHPCSCKSPELPAAYY